MILIRLLIIILLTLKVVAQTPKDFLPANFHKERRKIMRKAMPKNSVAVVFANPVQNRSNNIDYIYHQDPNFYYLTGLREPNALVLIFSEMQTDENGNQFDEILYLQKRNTKEELWTGKRLGVEEAKIKLGFAATKTTEEFINKPINFKKFENVFIFDFKNDCKGALKDKTDVLSLIQHFKNQSGYNKNNLFTIPKIKIYELIKTTPAKNLKNTVEFITEAFKHYPYLKTDSLLKRYTQIPSTDELKNIKQKASEQLSKKINIDIEFLPNQLAIMREIKTKEELKLIRKAINISVIGQIEVMKAMKPNMSEAEVQGIHEFIYKRYGAEHQGYPSIVGAGNNGCILHYTDNNKTKIADNDLVVMDLGAEYRGYTADITRTIPANGKFNKEQKAIYELVLKAQIAGIEAARAGNAFWEPGIEANKIISQGLFELGIINSPDEKHPYFPHGTSHYLGLDVHDSGTYTKLKPNTVITVEPGIYIPEGSKCDKKWWKIAVRIEDDILITNSDPINLSEKAPKTVKEIEKIMAEKSALENWVLPVLNE